MELCDLGGEIDVDPSPAYEVVDLGGPLDALAWVKKGPASQATGGGG